MWDVQVGRLMSMLKEKGVADKTAIFYTADNGAHQVRQPKKIQPRLFLSAVILLLKDEK